ncbi:RNase H domain-containing protein [Trichonephila clavipes]|nr:RNase H domain-containing protein [Trichonephila clavipes]
MEDNMLGYRLDKCCSIFTAEAIAFYRALQLIDPKTPVLLDTKSRGYYRQRASGYCCSVGNNRITGNNSLCDMKRIIQHRIHNAWQESWNLQTTDKLQCVKPVIGALHIMPMQRIVC